jgi:hypothetical protein
MILVLFSILGLLASLRFAKLIKKRSEKELVNSIIA